MKIVIVVPCYNEEAVLEKNIYEIVESVKNIPHDIKIVISDNASCDRTAEIGKQLIAENPGLNYVFVGEPGKGAAVLEAWKQYDADIYGFIDADLSTDLSALGPVLKCFEEGRDIAIGSRRIAGAKVRREMYRKITSAILNFLMKAILKTNINDTPCGFKFFKREIIDNIIPKIEDRKWVFDTEILILAERAGFKIEEIPVQWEEKGERGSKVNIYPTAIGYLKKIFEIKKRLDKLSYK